MKILSNLKNSITKKKRKKASILINVFNTSHKKNALVAYIKEVFENDLSLIDQSHTNFQTTLCISEILRDLGYNVDVISWNKSFEGDINKYELIIGLGPSLEKVLQSRQSDAKPFVICFATGCNPLFSNKVTIQRVKDFYYKTGKVALSSSRYIGDSWPLQHEIADWIILHGDQFAKSTYRDFNIDSVLAPVFKYHSITRSDEDWVAAKSHYLWFGSTGVVHKGLDILIDTFKNLPQFTLHICGHLENESEFYSTYKDDIEHYQNIVYHGFIKIQSERYKEILKKCAFIIFPSVSEANCAAVITCMANGGLIPIVSKNADINIDKYGVEILGFSESDILLAIEKSQQLSVEEIKEQSAQVLYQTENYHTFEFFKNDFKKKLSNALKI